MITRIEKRPKSQANSGFRKDNHDFTIYVTKYPSDEYVHQKMEFLGVVYACVDRELIQEN